MATATEFAKRLMRAAKQDFSKQEDALRGAADAFQESQFTNFAAKEDSDGVPWKPHAPLTIALYGVHPLLRLEGIMKEAATGGSGSFQTVSIGRKVSRIQVGISKVAVPYAKTHQDGRGRIPRRQFYYLHKSRRPEVLRAFRVRAIHNVRGRLGW